MTAAATDVSTNLSTRVTVATLVTPTYTRPATPASTAEMTYRASSTCHTRTPASRAAPSLSPTAYSSRP